MNDDAVYQLLIGDFLPPRVFDAHAHLFRLQDMGGVNPAGFSDHRPSPISTPGKMRSRR